MNHPKIVALFCLCLVFTTTTFGDGVKSQKGSSSEEIIGEQNSKQTKCQENEEKDCDIDYINSNETGPLDSHEAMNTRELKVRNKRSTEVDKKAFRNMLLGLVHKKSEDMKEEAREPDDEPQKFQSDASELLLELMVRIAAHPQQWDEVHLLLKKIDDDILTSKKIITDLQNSVEASTPSTTTDAPLPPSNPIESSTEVDEVQKLIILLDNEKEYQEKKNNTLSTWPNLEESSGSLEEKLPSYETLSEGKTTTQNVFPWSSKPKNSTHDFEFAYHRVTGLPLPYRSNYDKARARNAYIAVSVIAPKSRDNLLEDELRQLKPWSHEENLSKMENIRKKWFLRADPPRKEEP